MNASLFTAPCVSTGPGSHPSDKEIALLAFKHWKLEGCSHLRPEHWLSAERELMDAYAAEGCCFVPVESARLEKFRERKAGPASGRVQVSEHNFTTKGRP